MSQSMNASSSNKQHTMTLRLSSRIVSSAHCPSGTLHNPPASGTMSDTPRRCSFVPPVECSVVKSRAATITVQRVIDIDPRPSAPLPLPGRFHAHKRLTHHNRPCRVIHFPSSRTSCHRAPATTPL